MGKFDHLSQEEKDLLLADMYEALIEVKKYMKRAPFSVFQKIDAALAKAGGQ